MSPGAHSCWGGAACTRPTPVVTTSEKALPGNRRALPAEINMHSVKNRFLLRMKNISGDLYRRNWVQITGRDLVVVACCILWEHSSLKAFWFLAKNYKRVLAKRRVILQRQRADDDYIASWFNFEPVAQTRAEEVHGRSRAPQAHP